MRAPPTPRTARPTRRDLMGHHLLPLAGVLRVNPPGLGEPWDPAQRGVGAADARLVLTTAAGRATGSRRNGRRLGRREWGSAVRRGAVSWAGLRLGPVAAATSAAGTAIARAMDAAATAVRIGLSSVVSATLAPEAQSGL